MSRWTRVSDGISIHCASIFKTRRHPKSLHTINPQRRGGRAGLARYLDPSKKYKEKEGEVSFEESFKIKSPRERKNCDLVKCWGYSVYWASAAVSILSMCGAFSFSCCPPAAIKNVKKRNKITALSDAASAASLGEAAEAQGARVWRVGVQVLAARPQCRRSACATSEWRRPAELSSCGEAVSAGGSSAAGSVYVRVCIVLVLQGGFWRHVGVAASASGTFYNQKKKSHSAPQLFYLCTRDELMKELNRLNWISLNCTQLTCVPTPSLF